MEWIKINSLCKHIKMFRSTKSSISINSCTELSKTQFFSVSIVKLTSIHFVFKKRFRSSRDYYRQVRILSLIMRKGEKKGLGWTYVQRSGTTKQKCLPFKTSLRRAYHDIISQPKYSCIRTFYGNLLIFLITLRVIDSPLRLE